MKRISLILGLLALIGCERDNKHPGLSGALVSPVTGTPVSTTQPKIYLMLGQSNMSFMSSTYISEELIRLGVPVENVFNCALGGTSIDEWQKGQPLYNQAIAVYLNNKREATIGGVFFWQGEREAGSGTQADRDAWPQKFTQMVRDLRQDLGSPGLRVVYMQIGLDMTAYPNTQDMKNKQASVSIDNVFMTKSDDYVPDDGVHFSTSYKPLGERMAQAMVNN